MQCDLADCIRYYCSIDRKADKFIVEVVVLCCVLLFVLTVAQLVLLLWPVIWPICLLEWNYGDLFWEAILCLFWRYLFDLIPIVSLLLVVWPFHYSEPVVDYWPCAVSLVLRCRWLYLVVFQWCQYCLLFSEQVLSTILLFLCWFLVEPIWIYRYSWFIWLYSRADCDNLWWPIYSTTLNFSVIPYSFDTIIVVDLFGTLNTGLAIVHSPLFSFILPITLLFYLVVFIPYVIILVVVHYSTLYFLWPLTIWLQLLLLLGISFVMGCTDLEHLLLLPVFVPPDGIWLQEPLLVIMMLLRAVIWWFIVTVYHDTLFITLPLTGEFIAGGVVLWWADLRPSIWLPVFDWADCQPEYRYFLVVLVDDTVPVCSVVTCGIGIHSVVGSTGPSPMSNLGIVIHHALSGGTVVFWAIHCWLFTLRDTFLPVDFPVPVVILERWWISWWFGDYYIYGDALRCTVCVDHSVLIICSFTFILWHSLFVLPRFWFVIWCALLRNSFIHRVIMPVGPRVFGLPDCYFVLPVVRYAVIPLLRTVTMLIPDVVVDWVLLVLVFGTRFVHYCSFVICCTLRLPAASCRYIVPVLIYWVHYLRWLRDGWFVGPGGCWVELRHYYLLPFIPF